MSCTIAYRVIRRRHIVLALAIGAASPAAAQAPRFEPAPGYAASQDINFGGGLFEFLATGGMRTPPMRQAYAPMEPEAEARRAAADPRYERQLVEYYGQEKAGTVIINTPERLLYLIEPGGKALRYGIGVGRPGFTWAGVKYVSLKREWPDWRPPDEMLRRRPDLPHFMPGGPENPLGARALYLGSSLYRIHGSNEPWTIGTQVSSGCIRMRNEDVIDLYQRVPMGAKVVVL
jgi:lipoprotein-anchoring transpeptidase ErfK/SrfK